MAQLFSSLYFHVKKSGVSIDSRTWTWTWTTMDHMKRGGKGDFLDCFYSLNYQSSS